MNLLITAGGTREYIDRVRFISNASSGKTGYALARAALQAGHKVTLITATTNLKPPAGAKIVRVTTAAEMFAAVKKCFSGCHCLIMTAAVADYTPVRTSKTKIKKMDKILTLNLKPTKDILLWAGKHKKKNQIIAGFALEDKAVRTGAERKLNEKNLDMIIANTPSAIGAEKSTVHIKRQDGNWLKLENAPKTTIARKIISLLSQ